MIRYLGISGKVGAGKDTLADGLIAVAPRIMAGATAVKIALADWLKEVVCLAFGANPDHVWGTQEDKNRLLRANPPCTIRDALKAIGGAYLFVDPLIFVHKAVETAEQYAKLVNGDLLVVVPDIRFPHEVDAIRARDGAVVRLTRCMECESDARSETALNDYEGFDAIVDNSAADSRATLARTIRWLSRKGWADGKSL